MNKYPMLEAIRSMDTHDGKAKVYLTYKQFNQAKSELWDFTVPKFSLERASGYLLLSGHVTKFAFGDTLFDVEILLLPKDSTSAYLNVPQGLPTIEVPINDLR